MQNFYNEPIRNFSKEEHRSWIFPTIQKIRSGFPIFVPSIVNGVEIQNLAKEKHANPAKKEEITTEYSLSDHSTLENAIRISKKHFYRWSELDPKERTSILWNVGTMILEKRNELCALILLETGKTIPEAEADIVEAIDFCRYYAKEYEGICKGRRVDLPGEENFYTYKPKGIVGVIAPWNFPAAILTGMCAGPLVCGNAVLLKPAEQSSATALFLFRLFLKAGVPNEVFHFLPGKGEEIGAAIVKHPEVAVINFTGSREVGVSILRECAQVRSESRRIKRALCEMGGKNPIIVDGDADLDLAVEGALHSAFGFQGQKCSALSRLILLDSCYETFKTRFLEAVSSLKIDSPEILSAKIGPVITEESRQRLENILTKHKDTILFQADLSEDLKSKGHYVPPTVFEEKDWNSDLATKEFFGPLVTLFRVKTFDEAIEKANDSEYALTAGVYSRNPEHIEKAKRRIEAGNLYINRAITGAVVERQPFGGYKLSGVGAKAGGPDYLKSFLEPITITENTMRRGFTAELIQ
ncbi:aldehyde dehydrogenase family protein [Leptospira stimsonii]|uniref:L-glutamate gamma-semialdehyde dehydrogenase n=1 Tax=Leptospira stimsonii TaxID=2202203 RepID=A0ABY2NDL1_9LEPT|nr:aldehyde dehydrogenase family protein [Leptospira stimsonii]TGK18424.1 aldehyde dehydrogenase family protein [Leptospira stimsonii]TGM21936.1 aldehyde dehydrogenase family protein [Leptospira stimsonii]